MKKNSPMESILIVDDDLNLCTVLKEELEEVGYNSNFVNSGFEAMDFLKNNPVDLILPVVPSNTATCPEVGAVEITPTSVGVYVGLVAAFAHGWISDVGILVGKSVI